MKRSVKTITIIAIIILALLLYFFIPEQKPSLAPQENSQTTNPPEGSQTTNPPAPRFSPPSPPANCSDIHIKEVWDSVFKETSNSITIIANDSDPDTCDIYHAHKTTFQTAYILNGEFSTNNGKNTTTITAIKGNFTSEINTQIANINNLENITRKEHIALVTSILNNVADVAIQRNLTTTKNATDEYLSTFIEENLSAFTYDESGLYSFAHLNTTENYTITTEGKVYSKNSTTYYSSIKAPIIECTPNWVESETACLSSEEIITYNTDSNNCNNDSTIPDNKSRECDFDENGIIGNENTIKDTNLIINLRIDNKPLNLSKKYNKTESVKIREGNTTRILFDYNFSSPLNLKKITIKKQPTASKVGYLIVNGINAEKTITIDKKNKSSFKVCAINKKITTITAVSDTCDGTKEDVLNCPGTVGNLGCTTADNKFTVTGLDNSAVEEYLDGTLPSPSCIANWTCSGWTPANCPTNEIQVQTCADTNACNTTVGKPAETRTCTNIPTCTPNWNCSKWSPSECPSNKTQTRTCTDLNNCGTNEGKQPETQTCTRNSSLLSKKTVITIIVILILITATIILIILLKKLRNEKTEITPPPRIITQPPVRRQVIRNQQFNQQRPLAKTPPNRQNIPQRSAVTKTPQENQPKRQPPKE